MGTVKGFWQHENGKMYAVESDTFGKILRGVGPLNPDEMKDLEDYDYKSAIVDWLEQALANRKLHRVNPR
jgi:hypothetical protein